MSKLSLYIILDLKIHTIPPLLAPIFSFELVVLRVPEYKEVAFRMTVLLIE